MGSNHNLLSLNAFWNDFGGKSTKEFYKLLHQFERNLHFDFFIEGNEYDPQSYQLYHLDQQLPENIFVVKKHFIKQP